MLILSRRPGEIIRIGDLIKIQITEIQGNQVKMGFDAPLDLKIYREEIYNLIMREHREGKS